MPRHIPLVAALLLGLHTAALALDLPAGLSIDPPEDLDLTYQIIPAYDEKEKVVAGWNGEDLQYIIPVERLPPGHTDAQTYLVALARDLRKAWSDLDIGRQLAYTARNGLKGTVVELIRPAKGNKPATTLIVHFLTDGKASFSASVTPVPPASASLALDESLRLFATAARVDDAPHAPPAKQDELIGTWVAEETRDGRKVSSIVEFKSDGTFATTVTLDGARLFGATGAWSRRDGTLYWTYIDSVPELPAERREDEDLILAVAPDTLTLKSKLSGQERVFRRTGADIR